MKVNYKETQKGTPIGRILCGQEFMATRTNKAEKALYMKVDANSGISLPYKNKNSCWAVNLETGQIRVFDICTTVEPVNAIIDFA